MRLAVREVGAAARVLGESAPPVLAAPFFTGRVTGLPPSANYAEVLQRCGYLDSDGLTALIKAWIALFDLARPDVVVADHAPTAILAARVAGIPTAVIGSGFLLPPLAHPMPDLQPWQPVSRERLISAELRVLEPINRSLASLGGSRLETLAELFDVEARLLCTFEELDHYPPRHGERYWGPIGAASNGPPPVWPHAPGERLFVYLHHTYRQFDPLLKDLQSLGWPTLVVSPGIRQDRIEQWRTDVLTVSANAVDLAQVTREAQLAITHAPHGTVSALLRLGASMLLVPNYVEQAVLAYRFAAQGTSLSATGVPAKGGYAALVQRMVAEPAYRDRARRLALRYAHFDPQRHLESLTDAIVKLAVPER